MSGEGALAAQLLHEGRRYRSVGCDYPVILAKLAEISSGRYGAQLPPSELTTIARQSMDEPVAVNAIVRFRKHERGARSGQIVSDDQENIRIAIRELGLAPRYDAFASVTLVSCDGSDRRLDDALLDRAWLLIDEKFSFRPQFDFFQKVLVDYARRNTFHPVRDYLARLVWDRQPRLNGWLHTYAGASDTEYSRAVGALVLIAAARRVRQPGCKFDELLVLESPQGTLKSSALRKLCPVDEWFSDDLPLGVDAKQVIEQTAGKWIIEASELQGYSNAQIDRLKGMLARQVDGPVRLAYGRLSVEVPRQFVPIGTTNRLTEYLRDSTGNRRFWPVRIQQFDLDALGRDRDQLWAEAAYRESAGESIRLAEELWSVAAKEQEARGQVDPWEELLEVNLDSDLDDADAILVEEIWRALGETAKFQKKNDAERVADIMQRRGFSRKKKVFVVRSINGVRQHDDEPRRQSAWVRVDKDPTEVVVDKATEATPF